MSEQYVDDLVRELIAKGWDGWVDGMLPRLIDHRGSRAKAHERYPFCTVVDHPGDPSRDYLTPECIGPDIEDYATAALLAVEVALMQDGISAPTIWHNGYVWVVSRTTPAGGWDELASSEQLGIAMAKAWLILQEQTTEVSDGE